MKNRVFSFVILLLLVSGCSNIPALKNLKEDHIKPIMIEIPFSQGQVWNGYYICSQGKVKLNLRIQSVSAGKVKTELGDAYDVEAVFDFDFKSRTAAGAFHLLGKYYPEEGIAIFDPSAWIRRPPGYSTVGMDGLISSNGRTYSGTITHRGCKKFQVSLTE